MTPPHNLLAFILPNQGAQGRVQGLQHRARTTHDRGGSGGGHWSGQEIDWLKVGGPG